MKRLLPILLALLGLTACQTAKRNPNAPTPPSDAPVKIYDNDTGALLNDRTGQSSAGGGRVVVNNVSQIPALAPAVSPGSSFAYGRFNYSRVNAAAVAQVKSLEDKYKSAQSSLESLVKGGVAARSRMPCTSCQRNARQCHRLTGLSGEPMPDNGGSA